MSENGIDNNGGTLADQSPSIGETKNVAGATDSPDFSAAYKGWMGGGQNPPGSPAFPTLSLDRLHQERQEKMTALLSGSYAPSTRPFDPEYHSVMDTTPEKPKPWIGPDGGMIGRGIKAAGDWYMDYINKRRDGLIKTMNSELNDMFRPQLIDGINTWAHGMLTMYTGIDTGFEPKYGLNKLFMPNTWFNTGSGTPPVMGFQTRLNPVIPLLVTGARWWGDQNLKPSEVWNGAKAAITSGAGLGKSPADQLAQRRLDTLDKELNAAESSYSTAKSNADNLGLIGD